MRVKFYPPLWLYNLEGFEFWGVINSCETEQQLLTAHKYVRRVATVDFETALECGLYLVEKMQALRNPQEK